MLKPWGSPQDSEHKFSINSTNDAFIALFRTQDFFQVNSWVSGSQGAVFQRN